MWPRGSALFALVAIGGCAPTFDTEKSSLTVDGEVFRPTACQVHVGAHGGVTFTDGNGGRLTLALPPQHLDYAKEINGTPEVQWEAPSTQTKPAVEVGSCGALTLRGEGYHGQGKRAASGHATLSCERGAKIVGEIRWSGCF
jgi:hypothetical protein